MEVSKGIESKMLRAKMLSEFKKQNLVEEDLQDEDDKETDFNRSAMVEIIPENKSRFKLYKNNTDKSRTLIIDQGDIYNQKMQHREALQLTNKDMAPNHSWYDSLRDSDDGYFSKT